MSSEKPIIELDNVTLEIPLFSSTDFNLKKLIKSVTGGAFRNNRKRSYIKALDSINLSVKHEKNCVNWPQWLWKNFFH